MTNLQLTPLTALVLLLPTLTQALTIPYFAYGSNVYPNTMTALRGIECVDSTAAVLSGYKLRFNLPGIPGVEPSWACVEENDQANVHGVLYKLTPQDFARVSLSEGVPLGYQWRMVDVCPYVGDEDQAGQTCLREQQPTTKAYTLVSNNPFLPRRDIAPSKAYRDLILKGALEFRMDRAYIEELEATPIGFTFGEGYVAKDVLEAAERRLEESKR